MRSKIIKLIIILAIPVFVLTGFCFWLNSDNKLKPESNLVISVGYNQELFLRAVSRFLRIWKLALLIFLVNCSSS
jgi:hypothetical protein